MRLADTQEHKSKPFLFDYQMDAVNRMFDGCILNGGVGSGKSRTSLYYYFSKCGGSIDPDYVAMENPKDLYIITTAKKRDDLEWEGELANFLISKNPLANLYGDNMEVVIDSWNNVGRYVDVKDAFFIFDEQRVVGRGAWVKAFLKIAKSNEWILLSASPGDKWEDYIPVFLANGFYKNITEFRREHIVYSQYSKFPKVERYINTGRLIRLRNRILIDMDFKRKTIAHHEDVWVDYDLEMYKNVFRTRTDPFKKSYMGCKHDDPLALVIGKDISFEEVDSMCAPGYSPEEGDTVKLINEPIMNASGLCYVLRKVVNSDDSRQVALAEIIEDRPRVIVFYNFDYELDILLNLVRSMGIEVAQWNGHSHQPIPDCDRWVYLVQYTAGAEGWNSIKTDTIVFYSQNYSYKIMQQSAGRIDRLNTPYIDLHYYHLKSRSSIDVAISKALKTKKKFNESRWANW